MGPRRKEQRDKLFVSYLRHHQSVLNKDHTRQKPHLLQTDE